MPQRAAVAAACALAIGAATAGAAAQDACPLHDAGTAAVRAVLDARTIVLADGREVRLAAIETPDRDGDGKAALQSLIGGGEVALRQIEPGTDRYGRLTAFAFVPGDPLSAQHALLAAGHARVAARVGHAACAAALLKAERAARTAGLGLWSDPSNAPRRASDPAGVLAMRGRFALVEGRLVSVRPSGGTLYLNFGRRWSEDFTATVLRRNEKLFAAAGIELRKLSGRTVRVRGHVEERGGPWIELTRPEQIELAGRD
jgi:endonuclease YncB( thermonuclease family)